MLLLLLLLLSFTTRSDVRPVLVEISERKKAAPRQSRFLNTYTWMHVSTKHKHKNSIHTHVWEESENRKYTFTDLVFAFISVRVAKKRLVFLFLFASHSLLTLFVSICCLFYLSSYGIHTESAVESRITITTIKQLKQRPKRLPSKHGKSHFSTIAFQSYATLLNCSFHLSARLHCLFMQWIGSTYVAYPSNNPLFYTPL